MRNYDLGFGPHNLISIDLHYWEQENAGQNIKTFLNEIRSNQISSGILSSAVSEHIPGCYFNNEFATRSDGCPIDEYKETFVTSIDENFIDTYKMKITNGHNLSELHSSDVYDGALLNRTAIQELNITDPIGKRVWFKHGENYKVIGIVDDIHFLSLQHMIELVVYRYSSGYKWQYLTDRNDLATQKELIGFLNNAWNTVMHSQPFDYYFEEEKYQDSYKDEIKTAELLGSFSCVAILLACFGLLALTSLAVIQRSKEIGIRKILKATTASIMITFSSQYFKLILISNIIS